MYSNKLHNLIIALVVSLTAAFSAGVSAKSLYVIANINTSPTPIHSYAIGSAPNVLTFQAEQPIPNLAGGAVGIAIDETSKRLFVTYEFTGTIQLLDAVTFADLGTTVAPGASNLSGIVFHQAKNRVYTVDRNTNELYVYDWDSATNTLTQVPGPGVNGVFPLANVSRAFGIALDENLDRLYVADGSQNTVYYYETTNFTSPGSITLATHAPISIAVDQTRNFLYTGAAFNGSSFLVKYDLNTDTETSVNVGTEIGGSDGAQGVAVDETTGNVFATTGFADDWLVAFDSDLNLLEGLSKAVIQAFGDGTNWGDPTGLVVPRTEITFGGQKFVGVGEGGTGSAGPLELLLGLFVLPLVLARRGVRRVGSLLLAGLCLTLFVTSTAMAAGNGWYAGAGIGSANTDVSSSDYDADLAVLGYTTSSSMDDTDIGWKLFGGYEFTENLAVEGAYVDLGEVTSETSVSAGPAGAVVPQDFVDAAATVHPYSVDGFAITGKGTYPFGNGFSAFAKLGIFIWEADIRVSCIGCTTPVSAPDGEDGVDFTGGLGVGYDFANNFGVRAEWERFGTDRDDVDFFSASVLMRF